MTLYAPKCFSNDPEQTTLDIVELAKSTSGALECALYGYAPFSQKAMQAIRSLPGERKIMHLWQRKVSLASLAADPEALKCLEFEAACCKQLGISKAVMHFHEALGGKDPGSALPPKACAASAARAVESCAKLGLRPCFENVFETPGYFAEFFSELHRLGLAGLCGATLDTGHARAYSKTALPDWSAAMSHIESLGCALHYHIHLNSGLEDEHLSFAQAHTQGLLYQTSPDWAPDGFLTWLKNETGRRSGAIFCLEHGSAQAREAFAFLALLSEDGKLDPPDPLCSSRQP